MFPTLSLGPSETEINSTETLPFNYLKLEEGDLHTRCREREQSEVVATRSKLVTTRSLEGVASDKDDENAQQGRLHARRSHGPLAIGDDFRSLGV